MKNIYVIIGKSLSGKTTLLNELIKERPNKIRQLVTTTTRPQRKEENGTEYHFISQDEYDPERAIAPRVYKVTNHAQEYWTYFLDAQELKNFENDSKYDTAIMIIDYQGYLDLEKYVDRHTDIKIQGIYLDTDLITRLRRYLSTERQNDDAKETLRRLYKDEFTDFKSLDQLTPAQRLNDHKIHSFKDSQSALDYLLEVVK